MIVMRKISRTTWFIGAAVLVGMALGGRVLLVRHTTAKRARSAAAVAVTIAPVSMRSVHQTLSLVGSVVARSNVAIVSEVKSGHLDRIVAHIGQRVHRGQLLAVVGSSTETAAVDRAKAALDSAQGHLAAAQQGPKPGSVAVARAALAQSEAKLRLLQAGALPARLVPAQAAVKNAKRNLRLVEHEYGGANPPAVSVSEAAWRIAQDQVRLLKSGPLPAKLLTAQAALDAATQGIVLAAQQRATLTGPRSPATVALASARSTLNTVTAGMSPQGVAVRQDAAAAQSTDPAPTLTTQVSTAQAQLAAVQSSTSAQAVAVYNAQQALQAAQAVVGQNATTTQASYQLVANSLTSAIAQGNTTAAAVYENQEASLSNQISGLSSTLVKDQGALAVAQAQWSAAISAAEANLAQAQAQLAYQSATTSQSEASALAMAQAQQAQAQRQAQAALQSAQAGQAQAASLAQTDWTRAKSSYDQALAALKALKLPPTSAQLAVTEDGVRKAAAALAEARAAAAETLAKAQATYATAAANLAGLTTPPSAAQLAVSEEAVRRARAVVAAALTPVPAGTIQALKGTVAAAQSRLKLADHLLRQTQIRAPIGGVIGNRLLSVGAVVHAGKPIFTMTGPKLEVVASLSQQYLAQVHRGDPVAIQLPTGRTVAGRVRVISPTANLKTLAFTVYVVPVRSSAKSAATHTSVSGTASRRLRTHPGKHRSARSRTSTGVGSTGKHHRQRTRRRSATGSGSGRATGKTGLAPGQSVTLTVATRTLPRSLVVPTSALVASATGRPAVFVVSHGRAREVPVVTGPQSGTDTVIVRGVTMGESVVTLGQTYLASGDRVVATNLPAVRKTHAGKRKGGSARHRHGHKQQRKAAGGSAA